MIMKSKPSAKSDTPVFAITMGDPAGIGPEIALKACCCYRYGKGDRPDCRSPCLAEAATRRQVGAGRRVAPTANTGYRLVIIGDLSVLRQAAKKIKISPEFNVVSDIRLSLPGKINVLDMRQITPADFTMGRVSAACGRAAYAYILKGIELATQGIAAGVITNPINKEALKAAGINYPGHTEIFADKTGVRDFTMLFYLNGVGVAHVTTHCSLRQAIDLISAERVLTHIRLLDKAMKRLGVKKAPDRGRRP